MVVRLSVPCSFILLREHCRRSYPSFSFSFFVSRITEPPPSNSFLNFPYQNRVTFQSPLQAPEIGDLNLITYFLTLSKTLAQNPKDFKALSHLDSFLTHQTQFFDPITSVVVIDHLSQLNKLNRAKSVLLHLRNNLKASSYFLYSLVFDCLVKDGILDDVETFWKTEIDCHARMNSGSRVDLSSYVIHVCKYGMLDEIRNVTERILAGYPSRVLDRQSYLAVIGALCSHNEGPMAKLVLHEMMSLKGYGIDDITLIVMFQCFCRTGDLDEADWILRKLVERDCPIDICIYDSFMYGLCKVGKFREAHKLFKKLMRKGCLKDSNAPSNLKEKRRAIFQLRPQNSVPQIVAYETYFKSLCSAGKLEKADLLLKKMMNKSTMLEICVYGSFIKALFRAGREEDAMKFYRVECNKGLVDAFEMSRIVIMELCKNGKVDEAVRMFDEIAQSKRRFVLSVELCNSLLAAFWISGRMIEAEEFFKRACESGFGNSEISMYWIMIEGYFKHGNLEKVVCLFEKLLQDNFPIDGKICETVIGGLCSCGRLEEARKYLNYMIVNGQISCYSASQGVICKLIYKCSSIAGR